MRDVVVRWESVPYEKTAGRSGAAITMAASGTVPGSLTVIVIVASRSVSPCRIEQDLASGPHARGCFASAHDAPLLIEQQHAADDEDREERGAGAIGSSAASTSKNDMSPRGIGRSV